MTSATITTNQTTKPLRILHITFDMGIGGTEQVIKNLIEGSKGEQLKHHICCLEGPVGPWGKSLQEQGITIFKLQREPKITWKLIKQLHEIIVNEAIDIVHGHQYTPFVFGFFASRLTKAKVIFTEHGRLFPDIVSRKRKLINKLIFPFVDRVTAISKATRQALVKNEGIPAGKIAVIYNGIYPVPASSPERLNQLKQELDIPASATVFGTIARLDPIKNQTLMIKGFADAYQQNPDMRLVIVGDGPDRPNLEALITELQVTDVVKLTGYKPQPADYINLFDVFLLTSKTEGTSMTLLEAMSAGKPSIVTRVGGNPEIISEDFLGTIISENEQALCKSILSYSQPTQEFSESVQQHFYQQYSVEVFTDHFTRMYSSLTGARAQ